MFLEINSVMEKTKTHYRIIIYYSVVHIVKDGQLCFNCIYEHLVNFLSLLSFAQECIESRGLTFSSYNGLDFIQTTAKYSRV